MYAFPEIKKDPRACISVVRLSVWIAQCHLAFALICHMISIMHMYLTLALVCDWNHVIQCAFRNIQNQSFTFFSLIFLLMPLSILDQSVGSSIGDLAF